jgi:hypothetical protein
MGTVHTIFWQSHIFRSSVKSSLLMAKSHHSWRNPYWLAWPSVDWIRSSLNKWGLLQSFEVLSAEFMHSDIADEESRARSLRWAQPIFWASQRPFPWLGMVYTTHLPWFFGWLICVYFPRYLYVCMYIYIIILYRIYIYIHICIYVYNIFFRYLLVSLRVSEQKYGNTSLEWWFIGVSIPK